MTVSELIKKLQSFKPEIEVFKSSDGDEYLPIVSPRMIRVVHPDEAYDAVIVE